jgi:phosphoribosylformylglycinamidine synthase
VRLARQGHIAATRRARSEPPMKTRIYVTLKNGVLDPQGKAIHHALEGLGFDGVRDVRQGKLIELDLAEDVSDEDVEAMCRRLLANTVIENYRIERETAPA